MKIILQNLEHDKAARMKPLAAKCIYFLFIVTKLQECVPFLCSFFNWTCDSRLSCLQNNGSERFTEQVGFKQLNLSEFKGCFTNLFD